MKVEQITRERKRAPCGGCGLSITHVQIAGFTGLAHKVYQFVPVGHRRPDGTRCNHLAELREQAWRTTKLK